MNASSRLLSALALAAVSTAASAQAVVNNGVLTSQTGMTLYIFDKDAAGSSTCTNACGKLWAPLRVADPDNASGGSSALTAMDYLTDYSTIQREDGTRQWAYRGKPLYLFSRDHKPGDRNGDEFDRIRHVARPADSAAVLSR